MKRWLFQLMFLLALPLALRGQDDEVSAPVEAEPFITIPDTFYFYTPEIQLCRAWIQ